MKTNVLKSSIIDKIGHLQTEVVLEELSKVVDEMLDSESKPDWWDDLTSAQKRNIEISMEQINKGEIIDNEIVQAMAKTWLKK